jgi:preprotein translocase subunit SecE
MRQRLEPTIRQPPTGMTAEDLSMSTLAKRERGGTEVGLWRSLLQTAMYKPAQGRVMRQITGVALAIILLFIAYEIATMGALITWLGNGHYLVLLGLGALSIWLSYRLVNYHRFADFLISVEAEMNKVSWPGQHELIRASIVVMFVIFALAFVLYGFDLFWTQLFEFMRIRA